MTLPSSEQQHHPVFAHPLLVSWRPFAWLALIVVLVYGRTIFTHTYTYMDDHHLILESQHLLSDPAHVLKAFAEDVFHKQQGGMYYRPLLTISFMLDMFIGGTSPAIYHASNIVYHLIACFILLIFLKEIGLHPSFAFCASLLFALHPAMAQIVAWIPGRNESLLTIFVLLSFLALLRFHVTRRFRWYSAHVLLFLLGLLTKESALMLAPLSCVYLLTRIVYERRTRVLEYVLLLLGWFFMMLYWRYGREAAMIVMVIDYRHAVQSVLSDVWILLPFFGTILWPWNLFTVALAEDLLVIPGTIGLAALLIAFFSAKEKNWPLAIIGVSWFVFFLLPTFYRHPTVPYPQRFFEHRIYLSFIGFLLVIGSISSVQNWKPLVPYLKPVFVVLCLLLSVLAFQHSGAFADAMTFYEQATRSAPRNSFYHLELTMMELPPSLRDSVTFSKETTNPSEYYQRLQTIEGRTLHSFDEENKTADRLLTLGAAYFAMGRLKSAETALLKLLATEPENVTGQYNLGVLYYHGHKEQQSEQHWLNTVKLNPSHAEAHRNLCYLYYRWGNAPAALHHAQQATKLGAGIPKELLVELTGSATAAGTP